MSGTEALFGPPSEAILVSQFVEDANADEIDLWSTSGTAISESSRKAWLDLLDSQKKAIEAECRLV